MKLFKRKETTLEPLLATPKQPVNFLQACRKFKDRPCTVRYKIRKRPGVVADFVRDVPLSESLEIGVAEL